MSQVILHITSGEAWKAAQAAGSYEAPSLQSQGFIHLSKPEQVQNTLNRFYPNATEVLLLHINPAQLQATLKYEAPDHTGAQVEVKSSETEGTFPHLYGALNLDAVVDTENIHRSGESWSWSLGK